MNKNTTVSSQSPIDLTEVNERLSSADAESVVAWAAEAFGERTMLTSSFGAQAAVMLDMAIITSSQRPLSGVGREFLDMLVGEFSAHAAEIEERPAAF